MPNKMTWVLEKVRPKLHHSRDIPAEPAVKDRPGKGQELEQGDVTHQGELCEGQTQVLTGGT